MVQKTIKISLVFFSVLIVLVFIVLPHALPPVLENILKKEIPLSTGMDSFSLNVSSIGLSGIGLRKITTAKTISVDSVFLSYTPASLVHRQLKELQVSGLDVRARLEGSTLIFEDFQLPEPSKGDQSPDINSRSAPFTLSPAFISLMPGTISINHSVFNLKANGIPLSIPFNLSCSIKEPEGVHNKPDAINKTDKNDEVKYAVIECTLQIYPFGQRISVNLSGDMKGGITSASLQADAFDLGHLNGVLKDIIPGLALMGNTDIKITMAPLNWTDWHINLSHIAMDSPVKGAINDLSCSLSIDLSGERSNEPTGQNTSPPSLSSLSGTDVHTFSAKGDFSLEQDKFSPLNISYAATMDTSRNWSLGLKAQGDMERKFSFKLNADAVKMVSPGFRMDSKGRGEKGSSVFFIEVPDTHVEHDGLRASVTGFQLKGNTAFDFSHRGNGLELSFDVNSDGVEIETDGIHGKFPGISIPGTIKLDRQFTPTVFLHPSVKRGRLELKKYDLAVSRIDFSLPVVYALKGDIPDSFKKDTRRLGKKDVTRQAKQTGNIHVLPQFQKGSFSLAGITYQKNDLGRINGHISGTPSGALVRGNVDLSFLSSRNNKDRHAASSPDLSFESQLTLTEDNMLDALVEFGLKPWKVSSDLLKDSLPPPQTDSLTGLDFNFLLSSKGKFRFHDNHLTSDLHLSVSQGSLSFVESGVTLKGINTALSFQNLMPLRSKPAQVLSIASVSSANNLSLSNAAITYSIESPDSLLIENASFDWCGGRVTSQALRFSSKQDTYEMLLFCDRLKLSEILKQVGSFHAEGEGSLNGKIPISYKRGNISFDNGFLYSTPGMGGNIKIQGTEILTAGIPMDSPRFAQIDLAREALKNYRYNWARLGFNTEDDDLLIKMEFDGKPENRLPFSYNKELGGFTRVDASSPGSNFQGIKIDVNLKLPFNKVLKFGNKINKLF